MAAGLILPEDVGTVDATRVLAFLNRVADASVLADTVGFSEGPTVGRLVSQAIIARRGASPFATLDDLLAVTSVTPARFTEIVMALSGARPPAKSGARIVRILPFVNQPLLGQGIGLTVQLLDAVGHGVAGVEVTCVTTWGTLIARSGTETQRGASAKLVTERGGLIQLRLEPPISPPLHDLGRAMLDVELSRLAAATGVSKAAAALAEFADHYRAEAAEPLREAVDNLFASFPTEALTSEATWTVIPVTLIAFAGGEAADTVGLATVPVRSWLAAFLAALRASVGADRRLEDALRNVPLERTAGDVLARGIFSAQEALAGLEAGVLGKRFGDEVAGDGVSRFLDRSAAQIDAAAMVGAARAAGASAAAITGGGFAVFDAIGAVRDLEDTAGRLDLTAVVDARLGLLEQRLGVVESVKADRSMIDTLTANLARDTAALDGRIRQVEAARATDRGLIDTLTANAGRDTATLNDRITRIEAAQVTDRTALEARFRGIETAQATKADLASLETRLGQRITTDVGTAVTGVRTELGTRIDAKADVAGLTNVQQSLSGLQAESRAIGRKVDTLDTRVTTLDNTRIRPR